MRSFRRSSGDRRSAMDVHCSTCGEPWDVYHLWHEAIFETDLGYEEARGWPALPPRIRLSRRYRDRFRAAGWEFGASVLDVRRCPSCPPGTKPDPEKTALKAAIVEILGDDEDGIAATLEDYGL
jgi:hypothetical protein